MDISIILEKPEFLIQYDETGNEIKIPLETKTSFEKPIYLDCTFSFMPMLYINKEVYQKHPEQVIPQIVAYIDGLDEVDMISIPAELWLSPVKENILKLRSQEITILGNFMLSKEDYQLLPAHEKINVENCDVDLMNQSNIYLTKIIPYKSSLFSPMDQIGTVQRTEFLTIPDRLTEEMKEDLDTFFQWNQGLQRLSLTSMDAQEILRTVQFLQKYLGKIQKLSIDVQICDSNAEEFQRIQEILKEDASKITVTYYTDANKTKSSQGSCSLEEYIVMDEILSSYQKSIQAHNYSPLEQLIYAYDIVKNVKYQEASSGEDLSDTRKLHKVVLGGKIVCVGYSRLLNGLLAKLNIPATEYGLAIYRDENQEAAHQRSVVYLNDEKYGIDGVFVCDPTWDAKSTLDLGYDTPIDRYNHFLMSLDQMLYSKVAENLNGISILSINSEIAQTDSSYDACCARLLQINQSLNLFNTNNIVDKESSILQSLSDQEKEALEKKSIYEYVKSQFLKKNQKVPFEVIASAITTVRREEGVYQSEKELQEAMRKIIDLHNQFYPLAFDENRKMIYIKQNGHNQVIVGDILEPERVEKLI